MLTEGFAAGLRPQRDGAAHGTGSTADERSAPESLAQPAQMLRSSKAADKHGHSPATLAETPR